MRPPLVILSQTALRLTGTAFLGMMISAGGQGLGFGQDDEEESPVSGLPGMEMLVDGSILEKVLVPRYNEEHRLVSTLRAEKLVLVHEKQIDATRARIEFYDKQETLSGGIDLETAILTNGNMLRSTDPVELRATDMIAHGSGLIFQLDKSRGLLMGPAAARMLISQEPIETSMNTRSPLLSAAGALMLASTTVQAEADPNRLSAEEITGLDRLAVSSAAEIEEKKEGEAAEMEANETQVAQAGDSLAKFLKKAALELPAGDPADLTRQVPGPDLPPLKLPATVSAKDGIFFDSTKGVLILMKDVEFDHPQFSLQGADEVKVFFTKPAPSKGDAQKTEGDLDIQFGEPSKVTAVGQLVLEKKVAKPGDKRAKASGRQMIYDVENDIFIIRGGRPWVISDTASGYVTDPNGYIRVNVKTGDASFVGDSKAFLDAEKVDNGNN